MAKIVIKKLPPGPKPTRNYLDLRGSSEMTWQSACTLAEKERGNRVIVSLTVDHFAAHHGVPCEYLQMRDVRDVRHAMDVAKTFVQNGRAVVARVEGRAQRNYPGARPALWDLGGFKRVEYWEVVEALAGMPSGHDYYGDGSAVGVPVADLAAQIGISTADCSALLREAETLQLVRGFKRVTMRWYAVRYWRMELAKIERAAPARAGADR